MDQFMQNVTASVMLNAETVRTEYANTGIAIDEALTTPWDNAIIAMQGYETDGLAQMNSWLSEDGYFGRFLSTATYDLTTPWGAGIYAVDVFKSGVADSMAKVVSAVKSNVATATNSLNSLSGKISSVYKDIQDTEKRVNDVAKKAAEIKIPPSGTEPPPTDKKWAGSATGYVRLSDGTQLVKHYQTDRVYADQNAAKSAAKNQVIALLSEEFVKYRMKKGDTRSEASRSWTSGWANQVNWNSIAAFYKSGTTSTKKDEWAITDEPQYGDELVLVPNAAGNLSFMRKGTSVVPADITANLVEWGKLNPNMMSITNPSAGVNVISNAVNKPKLNFTFDSLVHVDHCDEGTLKDLEKMVDTKINDFTRKLNYSIKKFS